MSSTPDLLFGVLTLVLVALLVTSLRLELVQLRRRREDSDKLGWWASAEEQERLARILQRNPSFDERTGLTSDPELARWIRDNQP
jgi:hypothetical protein